MATITEDYVSFEIAKLLKEKGFSQDPNICNTAYTTKGKFSNNAKSFAHNYELIKPRVYSIAPTLQMACKWLREVHKIHISICMGADVDNPAYVFYNPQISTFNRLGKDKNITYLGVFDEEEFVTYEVACETAIMYCLEHLI